MIFDMVFVYIFLVCNERLNQRDANIICKGAGEKLEFTKLINS